MTSPACRVSPAQSCRRQIDLTSYQTIKGDVEKDEANKYSIDLSFSTEQITYGGKETRDEELAKVLNQQTGQEVTLWSRREQPCIGWGGRYSTEWVDYVVATFERKTPKRKGSPFVPLQFKINVKFPCPNFRSIFP